MTASAASTAPRTVSFAASSVDDDDDNNNDQQQEQEQVNDSSSSSPAFFFFLSESAVQQLPHFIYQGEDRSLLYYYVLSPLAQFCVDHVTPRSVAPNSITLFGLFLMITSYSAMWYDVPTLEPPPPCTTTESSTTAATTDDDCWSSSVRMQWIFLWNALAILCYQTLDNMDGKQARRTGSSSPLGLLFDHGCDAINSLFGSVGWMISCGLNPFDTTNNDSNYSWDAVVCFTMLFGPYALFYVGTWEEYYTGKLVMPIMNGPNEGLLGAILVSLTSWCYGPRFWQNYTAWDEYIAPTLSSSVATLQNVFGSNIRLRHVDLLVLASCMGYLQETSLKIMSVVQCANDKRHAVRSGVKIVVPHPQPWLDLLPFATLLVCFWIVGSIDLAIWLDMPRTSLHLSSVLFAEMTTDLMLAHVTGQAYQATLQQRWILLMPLILLTLAVSLGFSTSTISRRATSDFILVYTTVATCYFATKAVMVIHEICTVLNIWCFDITTPRKRQQHQAAIRTARHENGHSKTE